MNCLSHPMTPVPQQRQVGWVLAAGMQGESPRPGDLGGSIASHPGKTHPDRELVDHGVDGKGQMSG